MIFISRTPCPAVLQKYSAEWTRQLLEAIEQLNRPGIPNEQLKQFKKQKSLVEGKYGHEEVKNALIAMFHGYCAYCESNIRVTSYGAIEHFHPKSRYPEKTFTWTNLVLSCDRCNDRGHKGDNFPLDEAGRPLLIDPTLEEPTQHLQFAWDEALNLVYFVPLDKKGEQTIEIFDLNGVRGRKELLTARRDKAEMIRALIKLAESDEEAQTYLQELQQTPSSYKGMTIFLLHYFSKNSQGTND